MRAATMAALASLAMGRAAWAARPFVTDDAGTAPKGGFEAELGTESWSDAADFGVGLKHGITSRMDLGVSGGYALFPRADRSVAPAGLSFKFALVPDFLSAGFSTELGSAAYSVNGIASKTFGDFGVNLNLGGEFEGGSRDADLSWGLNPLWHLGPATLGAELRGDQRAAQAWKAGAQWRAADGFALDLGIGSDIQDDPRWRITAGAWFAFGAPEGGE